MPLSPARPLCGLFLLLGSAVFGIQLAARPVDAARVAAPSYSLTLLNGLDSPRSITDAGVIVGGTQVGVNDHSIRWENGVAADLDGDGYSSFSFDVNSAGQIAGVAEIYNPHRAYIWSAGTRSEFTLDIQAEATAVAINEAGQAVGHSNKVATIWEVGSEPVAIPYLETAFATGINDAAGNHGVQVVGNAFDAQLGLHAWIEENGSISEMSLGALGSHFEVHGINDQSQVVGRFLTAGNFHHALFWQNGSVIDLQTPAGSESEALAINNVGQIVGNIGTSARHAALWQDGQVFDLNNLIAPGSGVLLERAYAINNNGQIAGEGFDNAGHTRGFLLTPVPVPPTLDSVSPDHAVQGQTLTVTLTGTGLGPNPAIGFGEGISVNTVSGGGASLNVNITLETNATPGPRTVRVTNTDNQFAELVNGFTVQAAQPAGPVLKSFLVSAKKRGKHPQSEATVTAGKKIYGFFKLTGKATSDSHIRMELVDGKAVTRLPDVNVPAGSKKSKPNPVSTTAPPVSKITTVHLRATYPDGPGGVSKEVEVTINP